MDVFGWTSRSNFVLLFLRRAAFLVGFFDGGANGGSFLPGMVSSMRLTTNWREKIGVVVVSTSLQRKDNANGPTTETTMWSSFVF